MSLATILSSTSTWVWILLAVLVSRGMKALKGGTAPIGKLAIVPAGVRGLGFAASDDGSRIRLGCLDDVGRRRGARRDAGAT